MSQTPVLSPSTAHVLIVQSTREFLLTVQAELPVSVCQLLQVFADGNLVEKNMNEFEMKRHRCASHIFCEIIYFMVII